MNSSRVAALVVTLAGGLISLVLGSLFAFIASSVAEGESTLWVLFGICVYLLLISVTCAYVIASGARRSPLLLIAIMVVLPCVMVSAVAGASSSWAVMFIPTVVALAFVLVGVILTWRVRS